MSEKGNAAPQGPQTPKTPKQEGWFGKLIAGFDISKDFGENRG